MPIPDDQPWKHSHEKHWSNWAGCTYLYVKINWKRDYESEREQGVVYGRVFRMKGGGENDIIMLYNDIKE